MQGSSAALARGLVGAASILVFAAISTSALAVQAAVAAPALAPGAPSELRSSAAMALDAALAKGG